MSKKVNSNVIIIASPHRRNDKLCQSLSENLKSKEIIRIVDHSDLSLDYLVELDPEWIFFPHWSWLIPEEICERFQCVIFHMTDLPYGRGGSPLQNLILRGHLKTMLSAIKCVTEVDAGPVYCKTPLGLEGTAEEILQRSSSLMEQIIVEIVSNHPIPKPQVGKKVEFKRLKPENGSIDCLDNLNQVYDYIRMLDADGYAPAFSDAFNFQLDITQANWNGEFLEAKVRIRRKENE